MSKRVAVLACLTDLDPRYSVAGVVRDHLKILSAFESPVFITTNDFRDHHLLPANVEVRTFPRWTFGAHDVAAYEAYKTENLDSFCKLFSDVEFCMLHDVMFVDGFLPANVLVRAAQQKLKKVVWANWAHSAPSINTSAPYPLSLVYQGMPMTWYVCLNRSDVAKMAGQYQVPEGLVRTVFNMLDPELYFNWHPLTCEIYRANRLWEVDHIICYPVRPTSAKQPDKLLKMVAAMKRLGRSVKLILASQYSNGQTEREYLNSLHTWVDQLGLTNDVIFTYNLKSEWADVNGWDMGGGVPRQVTSDLMGYADVFLLPSISESCSMVMLEASLRKNLVVLNDDMMSSTDFGGQKTDTLGSDRVLYFQFGSITRKILSYNPSEEEWYTDHAKALIDRLDGDMAVTQFRWVRSNHDPHQIYQSQMAPLIRSRPPF